MSGGSQQRKLTKGPMAEKSQFLRAPSRVSVDTMAWLHQNASAARLSIAGSLHALPGGSRQVLHRWRASATPTGNMPHTARHVEQCGALTAAGRTGCHVTHGSGNLLAAPAQAQALTHEEALEVDGLLPAVLLVAAHNGAGQLRDVLHGRREAHSQWQGQVMTGYVLGRGWMC